MELNEMKNTIITNDMRQSAVTSDEFSIIESVEPSNSSIKSRFSEAFLTTTKYESHPFAEIFPDSTDIEFENLLEDMKNMDNMNRSLSLKEKLQTAEPEKGYRIRYNVLR